MKPYRKERVASQVHDVVSEIIAHKLNDPRIIPLTTITRVQVTGDLLQARIFLSIPGGDAAENKTMAALRHATGFVQRMVAHELSLRLCPELRFEIDESVKGARRTLELLAENRRREPQLYETEDKEEQPSRQDAECVDETGGGESEVNDE
ncbi:MAG: 30S ribosome-binding factor RbfA [Planctomycetota bacterium]